MTSKIEDGGDAFACASENGHQPGMSLRDYFAGQALAGILASLPIPGAATSEVDKKYFAEASYLYADAMLQARKGGE